MHVRLKTNILFSFLNYIKCKGIFCFHTKINGKSSEQRRRDIAHKDFFYGFRNLIIVFYNNMAIKEFHFDYCSEVRNLVSSYQAPNYIKTKKIITVFTPITEGRVYSYCRNIWNIQKEASETPQTIYILE